MDYQIMKKQKVLPADLQQWVDARQRFRLSHKHIQMARELGLNPKKFGKLANHKQEPWKEPLSNFILQKVCKARTSQGIDYTRIV